MRLMLSTAMLTVALSASSMSLAAGVPLPTGPCPIDPGFGNNVTYTRALHVATTGSDASGDGSSARPYATVGQGLSMATAGTKRSSSTRAPTRTTSALRTAGQRRRADPGNGRHR